MAYFNLTHKTTIINLGFMKTTIALILSITLLVVSKIIRAKHPEIEWLPDSIVMLAGYWACLLIKN